MSQRFLVAFIVLVASTSLGGGRPRESTPAQQAFLNVPSASDRQTPTPVSGNNALSETLVSLEKQSWVAWTNRDGKFFQEFLSDDHVEVGADGVSGKSAIVPFVAGHDCVVNSYAVDHFQLVAFDANTAVLTYHAQQDTLCFGKPVPSPVWVSSLYVRRGGRWLNALYQHSAATR